MGTLPGKWKKHIRKQVKPPSERQIFFFFLSTHDYESSESSVRYGIIALTVCSPNPQNIAHYSVEADSLQPHGLQPARLLWPRDSPGKNTGVGCCFLLQGNLPDPGIESTSPVSPALAGGSFSHWAIQRIWSLSFQIFPFAFCLTLMTLSTSCFGFLSFFLGSCFSPNSGKALPVTSFESYLFSSFAHPLFCDWWDVRPSCSVSLTNFSPVISPTCIFL